MILVYLLGDISSRGTNLFLQGDGSAGNQSNNSQGSSYANTIISAGAGVGGGASGGGGGSDTRNGANSSHCLRELNDLIGATERSGNSAGIGAAINILALGQLSTQIIEVAILINSIVEVSVVGGCCML